MIYRSGTNGHADQQKVGSMETGTSAMEWVFNGSNQIGMMIQLVSVCLNLHVEIG